MPPRKTLIGHCPVGHPVKLAHLVPDRLEHPVDLTVPPLVNGDFDDAILCPRDCAHLRGRGAPLGEPDPRREPDEVLVCHRPIHGDEIGLPDLVPGVHHRVRKIAVVGQDQDTRRVAVEAADRINALVDADVITNGAPPPLVVDGRDGVSRLVEEYVHFRIEDDDLSAVKKDRVGRGLNPGAKVVDHLVIHGDAARGDEFIRLAP